MARSVIVPPKLTLPPLPPKWSPPESPSAPVIPTRWMIHSRLLVKESATRAKAIHGAGSVIAMGVDKFAQFWVIAIAQADSLAQAIERDAQLQHDAEQHQHCDITDTKGEQRHCSG